MGKYILMILVVLLGWYFAGRFPYLATIMASLVCILIYKKNSIRVGAISAGAVVVLGVIEIVVSSIAGRTGELQDKDLVTGLIAGPFLAMAVGAFMGWVYKKLAKTV